MTGTNGTTPTRTTGFGSGLFKTDSSSCFRELMVPPRSRMLLQLLTILLMRKIVTCRHFLTSFLLPFNDFLHTGSNLAMWNSKLSILSKQTLGSLEFAGKKSEAVSISIPAGVLADSFSDWIRENLPSDSNESHRCCSCTAATLTRNKLNVNCFRISSSSTECFIHCTFASEGSDLDAKSDTALAHMDRSIRSKVINPESNSRSSTSSSEYFLPYKASSRKRKLNENTKEAQESILNEADVESQSVVISSLSQSMLKIVLQHHLLTGVIDAVETEIQPKPPENSSESTIDLQHQESSVTVEKRPEFDDPSIDNSQKTQEPGTTICLLKMNLRNRGGRSANLMRDDNQQQMRDSLNLYNLPTPCQVPSSHRDRPNLEDDLTGPQIPRSITIAAATHRMTSKETQTKDFENVANDSSDASTALCKQEPLSPGSRTELYSYSKNPEQLIPEDIADVASCL
nr:hypothetical protein HmN_000980800 [Hymenolepis microstoma]